MSGGAPGPSCLRRAGSHDTTHGINYSGGAPARAHVCGRALYLNRASLIKESCGGARGAGRPLQMQPTLRPSGPSVCDSQVLVELWR